MEPKKVFVKGCKVGFGLNFLLCVFPLFAQSNTEVKRFGNGQSTFDLSFQLVGNAGNPANTSSAYGGQWGAVSYDYGIATFEVTREVVDKVSILASLGIDMTDLTALTGNGSNKPATGLSWIETAKFVNYLNTARGLPPAYKFSGNTLAVWTPSDSGYDVSNPYRNKKANYFIPTANEWNKAAYYDPNKGGAGVGGYWLYPTKSDTPPAAVASGTSLGTAVYGGQTGPADVSVAGGVGPYGTYGQGGNAKESLETAADGTNDNADDNRLVAGGDWGTLQGDWANLLGGRYGNRDISGKFNIYPSTGFRVVRIAQNLESNSPAYSTGVSSNVAIGKAVTASGILNTNHQASKVVNDITNEVATNSWYAKDRALPAWVIIDLGQSYPISGLSILNALNTSTTTTPWYDAGAKDISIQTSTDGISYTTIIASSTLAFQSTSFQDQSFSTVINARYVKVNVTSAYGSTLRAGLNEVRVISPQVLPSSYVLVATCDPLKGSINVSPNEVSYSSGNQVAMAASPLLGYVFSNWSGASTATTSSITLTMDASKTVTANFIQDGGDNDGDGLTNYQESITFGTNPNVAETTSPVAGLYLANQMQAMAIGELVLTKNANGSFTLNYDIEKSEDLQSWTTYAPLSLTLTNLPPDKAFIRIKAKQ